MATPGSSFTPTPLGHEDNLEPGAARVSVCFLVVLSIFVLCLGSTMNWSILETASSSKTLNDLSKLTSPREAELGISSRARTHHCAPISDIITVIVLDKDFEPILGSWEANSQVQNVKLGGHQTCLSINRLWHELRDMLRRLVGTAAPGHHDCSIQE
ncbi:hypothetical protein TNCV_809181 [Trichonephila clavipes]|nr:hypothetical protein TNCV_809181 [Trichonephila clavipes]